MIKKASFLLIRQKSINSRSFISIDGTCILLYAEHVKDECELFNVVLEGEMREYHVAKNGCDKANGSKETPFFTIGRAALVAEPGDHVIVHEGTYRESVSPCMGGRNEREPIIYEAAHGEKVIIKGSEVIKDWLPVEGSVWKVTIPDSFFGNWNPYREEISGDWLIYPKGRSVHVGDVYLNGRSFYEASSFESLLNPEKRIYGISAPWLGFREELADPEGSLFQWYAVAGDEETVIYADFRGADPNVECVEINVRKTCFYPEKTGINFITVRGFEFAHAACPWAPPTADQPGMVGPHWAKGWIIEENVLHDAKCSAISLGKEESTGHNLCTRTHRKPGYQYQMEAVFEALQKGWSKELIGSHIVRGNTIYDCGQNGIVGHMGCIFSTIENNHIYRIGRKYEFFGHEIAAIKLHAAIDTQIIHNCIHDCQLGTWLDWQAQGARLSRSIYFRNGRDLFVEVTHGPLTIDHNIFLSNYWFDYVAQGTAFVHNMVLGCISRNDEPVRTTPYHFPHTTAVHGTAFVYGGDDRWYQNVFVGGAKWYPGPVDPDPFFVSGAKDFCKEDHSGTANYNGSPVSLDEYIERVTAHGNEDLEMFIPEMDPVYIDRNVYLNHASPFNKEEAFLTCTADPQVQVYEEADGFWLSFSVPEEMISMQTAVITSAGLGTTRITEGGYENPDGTDICFDEDLNGIRVKRDTPLPGPLEGLHPGENRVRVW